MNEERTGPSGSADCEGAPGSAAATPQQTSDFEAAMAERLRALDHLYESKQITATELGEARRRILAEGPQAPLVGPTVAGERVPSGIPAGPPTEAAPPAAPPPPVPPKRVDGGHVGPPAPPPAPRLAGLPVWAAALVGVLVVGMVAIGAWLLFLRGGDDQPSAAEGQAAAAETYAVRIRTPLDQLTKSAVATGKSLARVSEPGEIGRLNRTVERQLDVVEGARASLARISVVPSDQRAHRALIAAAAHQRRYLVALGRASSGEPSQARLAAINRARKAGGETIRAYTTFFRLAPAAPDAITTTDLTDTAGLRAATQAAIADSEAPPPPSGGGSSRSGSAGGYTSPSFQSPTGNLRCQASGGTLFCSSSNDGFGVALPSAGPPSTGSGIANGGQVVPYGSSWSNGPFTCDSAFDGITCRNLTGNGFFLNRDTYTPF